MAKSKGKSKAAATAAASNVEGASGNDKTIVDPAPSSKPVAEVSKAAAVENTAVLDDDKPEEVVDNNKEEEETENGDLDEPEEIDEVEEEEPKEVLDAKLEEEVDKVEEAKDGLDDKAEEGEDDEADDESEEEGEEGDAKEEDGIVESVGTDIVPEGENVEGEKPEGEKVEGEKPEGEKVEGEKKVEGEDKVVEAIDVKDNNPKEGGATPNKNLKKLRRRKKKTAATSVAAAVSDVAGKSLDLADKQGAAAAEKKKELKMADGMGLVFMCNAKTKQDCFRYNVLGLPASKKEMVAKIYRGMRLFLFDIDLKLMYGIYKAASPGGYNIEPKAFKSAFPAQVRFKVLNDCLPLPEEKFKAAIKENYYGKNKFNCQLSQEQVKNLCKLFQKAGKIPKNKNSGEVIIAEPELPPSARGRRNTRKAVREEPERGRPKNREVVRSEPQRISSARGRKRTVEAIRAAPERVPTRGHKRSRHEGERGRRDNGVPRSGDRYARREEAYPVPRGGGDHHLHARRVASPPPPTYAYGRQGDEYYYRRDHLPPLQPMDPREYRRDPPPPQPMDPREYRRDPPPQQPMDPREYRRDPPPPQPLDPRDYHRAVELETRPRQPVEYRDAYGGGVYREAIPYNEYAAPPASYAAAPPPLPSYAAYAPPPSGNLGLSGYAPPSGNLGPSGYAPSSSLYYRY